LGRRRLSVLAEDFSILETKEECFIFCLSRFEEEKDDEGGASGLGRPAVEGAGREARTNFARVVVRFFVGA
jgi:hypothetical protein